MEIVLSDICEIVSSLFDISLDDIRDNQEKSLFSQPFHLRPTELLLLFFYLEEKYKIHFDEKDVSNFSFTTIRDISKNVNNHINN